MTIALTTLVRAYAVCTLLLAIANPVHAARVALVIGNAAYADGPLRNPVNDARAMDKKLASLGFSVQRVENLKRQNIGRTIANFANSVKPGDEAVVFYAGHGVQVKGVNYLPAVDADIQGEEDVALNSLNLNSLMERLEEAKAGLKILFLDACRNNPYARSFRSGARGLARVQDAPSGTLIHFATRPGSVAADGTGANGLYTSQLLKHIDTPNTPVEQMLKTVSASVEAASQGQQEPWSEGSIKGNFFFKPGASVQVASLTPEPTGRARASEPDEEAWSAAKAANTPGAYRAYLSEFPSGRYASAARIALGGASQPPTATPQAQASPLPRPTGPAELPAQLIAQYQISDKVTRALRESEHFRNAPAVVGTTVQLRGVQDTEYTGSESRSLPKPGPTRTAEIRTITPVGIGCAETRTNNQISLPTGNHSSTMVHAFCGGALIHMGMVSDGKLAQRLENLELTGSLFPPREGANLTVRSHIAFLSDRKFDTHTEHTCAISGSRPASELYPSLTGRAWVMRCQGFAKVAGDTHTSPSTTNYFIEDLGLFDGSLGVFDYQSKSTIFPTPQFRNILVSEGQYGSRITTQYEEFRITLNP